VISPVAGRIEIIALAILQLGVATYLYPGLWGEIFEPKVLKRGRVPGLPAVILTLGAVLVPLVYDGAPQYNSVLFWYLVSVEYLAMAWVASVLRNARAP